VGLRVQQGSPQVDTDSTVQTFAHWLTELKTRNSNTLQQMLSEMSIIRDGITSNNMELTEFKRHSTGISQQMQSQLTDLREKLTNAFGEITSLVKQKTSSDQEMMQDINSLQQGLSYKTSELESLKRSYSQAHQQLQNSLIQIRNHLSVTNNEVSNAKNHAEKVQKDTVSSFSDIDSNLRGLEDQLAVGNAENRNQMLHLQEDISRIHESLTSLSAEFLDHKRSANSVHNRLQSQVWSLEEGRKRSSIDQPPGRSFEPEVRQPTPPQSQSSLAPTPPQAATISGMQAATQPAIRSIPAAPPQMPAGARVMGPPTTMQPGYPQGGGSVMIQRR
jgi:chromosome segregation ATPase